LEESAPAAKDIGLVSASAIVRGPLRIISGAIPKKPLYSVGNISVRKALLSPYTIEEAASIADAMQACDKFAASMGFARPGPTDIVMGKGPGFHGIPKLDVISGKYKDVIYLKDATSDLPIDSLATVGHERFHNILISHYGLGSYTSKELAVQEALADIGAALFARSPHGNKNLIAQDVGYIHLEKSIKQYDAHRASLLFSMPFWKLRNVMGDQDAKKLYKALVDDLNSCRGSYLGFLKEAHDPDSVLSDLIYFSALILKNTAGNPKEELIRNVLQSSLAKYKVNLSTIQSVSEKLIADPSETLRHRNDRTAEAILIDAIGAASLGAGGTWVIQHYTGQGQ
jgi:hypothetical protein